MGKPCIMNIDEIIQRFYNKDQINTDSSLLKLINKKLDSDSRVLEAGAGTGKMFQYSIKSDVKELIGADLDPRVLENPQLHKGVVTDLTNTPFDDEYFDLIFSRYVLEHVKSPAIFVKEMHRLLKPGGGIIFLTPNKWHYVSLCAKLTPNAFHAWYNKKRGISEDHTFPTFYKLNSAADIDKEFAHAGFIKDELTFLECAPNYLKFNRIFLAMGIMYERTVNKFNFLSPFRVNILGCYIKKR